MNLSNLPIRTTSRHEDDIVPVLWWFVLAHAGGFAAHHVSAFVLEANGVTKMTTVTIVGGGSTTTQTWALANYYAMWVQATVFFVVFGLFILRNHLR